MRLLPSIGTASRKWLEMPQRPGKCYRSLTRPPYTRRKYIRGVPGSKIVKFDMGNTKRNDFPVTIGIITKTDGQIRHCALEAARIAANAYMTKNIELENFWVRINVKPHHVLRENKMMAFAGADRLQAGMRHSFGKPSGTAARVHNKQVVMLIRCNVEGTEHAFSALRRANMKLPIPSRIRVIDGPEAIKRKYGIAELK